MTKILNEYKVEYKILKNNPNNETKSDTVCGKNIKDVLTTMNKVHSFVKIEVISITLISKSCFLSDQYEVFIINVSNQAFECSPFKCDIPEERIEEEITEWLWDNELDFYQATADDVKELVAYLQGTGYDTE